MQYHRFCPEIFSGKNNREPASEKAVAIVSTCLFATDRMQYVLDFCLLFLQMNTSQKQSFFPRVIGGELHGYFEKNTV